MIPRLRLAQQISMVIAHAMTAHVMARAIAMPTSSLALLIEAHSHQDSTKNQSTSAKKRRDDMRRAFRALNFQIPDLGNVFGLLCREYRDREPRQPMKDQSDSADS